MKYSINLFPKKEQDVVDKIIYFSFHYLRYILVITQFVVICVFFFRFKVDQEIVDLKDSLSQKKQIVEATDSMLDEVKYLEEKTTSIRTVLNRQDSFKEMFDYFTSTVPDTVTLSTISVEPGVISCEGYSTNPAAIQGYYNQLLSEQRFEVVELINVRKANQGFSFGLQLEKFKSVTTDSNEQE